MMKTATLCCGMFAVVLALALAPGFATAQACPPSPGVLACSSASLLACGQGESYDKDTQVSSLATPLNALGQSMGQVLLKCTIDGVPTSTDGMTLGAPLNCPLPFAAAEPAKICKCGLCTTAAVPALGYCKLADAPVITCTNRNASCSTGNAVTAATFGCTTSLPTDKVAMFVDTKASIPCSAASKVHIVSAKSDAGCYSVMNTGTSTYVDDENTIPNSPCDSCTPQQTCFQGQCCLDSGDVQVTLSWDGNSNLDLEVNHLGCVTNPQFPNGNAQCSSALLPTGKLYPVMDRISGAATCAGPMTNTCGGQAVENIAIPTIGSQKLFMVYVKGTNLCGPTPFQLDMKIRNKFVTINGVVQPGFFPNANYALYDF